MTTSIQNATLKVLAQMAAHSIQPASPKKLTTKHDRTDRQSDAFRKSPGVDKTELFLKGDSR